jgi:hypothetical protein
VLTGRSADVGVSHESRHNLHKLLEREGRGRSGTLLIRQQGFDGLTEQVPLACLFDRLQAWLPCMPAITPPPYRFIIDLQMLGNAGVTGPFEGFQDNVSSFDQSLGTRRAVGHFLQQFLLQGTGMKQFCSSCSHTLPHTWRSRMAALGQSGARYLAARCENGPGRRHCARVHQRWSGPRGRSLHLRPASSRADDLPRPLLRLFVELGVMETPA